MLLALLAMVTGPSDEDLVRRFQGGDRHAFSAIVQRYQDRIYTLCLRWMGDAQVAEEVAQDVFIAIFRSLGDFRGDARLSTWVWRVAVNHCKNRRVYRRRRAMERHEPLEGTRGEDEPARQLPHQGPGSDAGREQSEAEALVHEGLAQLEASQRAIIVMRDIEDLSYEEIAEILELPRGTVKSRLHRARAELAKVLARRVTREDVL